MTDDRVGSPDLAETGETDLPPPGLPAIAARPAPETADPSAVRRWFGGLLDAAIPAADGTLATARRTADALARRANADNTRRAYRAGVRAWCTWCARHDLPALPAAPADIAAFLSAARYPPPGGKPLAVNTVKLRKAAIRYLHYLARLPSPTSTVDVTATLAGITRDAAQYGDGPRPKLAARIGILREILAPPATTCAACAIAPRCWSASRAPSAAPSWRALQSSISRTLNTGCASPCPSPRATGR
jgi:hypothetical protein